VSPLGVRRVLRVIRHPVSRNALALQAGQAANLIVPLVTLPYTSRVLGPDGFGLVAFSQGLSFILGVIVGFGFEPWASREVAVALGDRPRLSALTAQVTGARSILSGAAFAAATIVYLTSSVAEGSPEFVAMAWLAAVGTGLNPWWFFIGHERVRLVALVAISCRVAAAALTFVLVQDPGDAWIVMALFTASAVLPALVNTARMYGKVQPRWPSAGPSLQAIRSSAPLFAGVAGRSLYSAMNVVLLGFLASRTDVAHFSAAERVIRSCTGLLIPVTVAMYPRVTRLYSTGNVGGARRLLRTGGAAVFSAASLGAAIAFVFAPEILRLIYGPEFGAATEILRILAPILPITTVTSLAMTWLMARRSDSTIMRITLAGGALNVALAPILVHRAGVPGMAVSVLCAELLAMSLALAITLRARRGRAGDDQVAGEGSGEAARA
jgi:PST family polysaccharide transporter